MTNTIQKALYLQHCSLGWRGWRRRARGCTAAGWGGGTRSPGTASTSPDASSPCIDACRGKFNFKTFHVRMWCSANIIVNTGRTGQCSARKDHYFTFHKMCTWEVCAVPE